MREYIRLSKNKTIHSILAEFFDMMELLVIVMFCIILLFTYVVQIATVQGDSMIPTLKNDDKLLVSVLNTKPECGDLVIVNAQDANLFQGDGALYTTDGLGKVIVKRVIAVSGQTLNIDFDEGVVYVDGQPIEETYINNSTTTPSAGGAFDYPITIPDGYLFVMGDNRNISKDSRYSDVGLVRVSDVIGEVVLRLYPLETFGAV